MPAMLTVIGCELCEKPTLDVVVGEDDIFRCEECVLALECARVMVASFAPVAA